MLSVRNLTVCFGRTRALSDVTFELDTGMCFVCGPNGAGKTTLLRALCGAVRATSGLISLDGLDIFADPMRARRHTSFLPDKSPLYPDLTVEEHLTYRGRLKGLSGRRLMARLRHVVEALDLKDIATTRTSTLSAGQRRRTGIADALLCDSRLLLIDEPFAGLDYAHSAALLEVLTPVAKHAIVLLATHDTTLAERTQGQCLVLCAGNVAGIIPTQDDTPLSNRCADAVAAAQLAEMTK